MAFRKALKRAAPWHHPQLFHYPSYRLPKMANNNKKRKRITAHVILYLLHLQFLSSDASFPFSFPFSLHSWHRTLGIQWPLLRILGSQLSSTYLVHLPSCWPLLYLEFSPSTTESISRNGISPEEERARDAPGISWASS